MVNERASKLSGSMSRGMSSDDLIAFIMEEAHHHIINDECMKNAESALAAHTKGSGKAKGKKKNKDQSKITCNNCHMLSIYELALFVSLLYHFITSCRYNSLT